jgi:steroid delta-isomerase-like uncharacterized protein
MESSDMKRLYVEHHEVEEARDLDAVVATFDEDCLLENVALGTKASGRDEVRKIVSSALRDVSRSVSNVSREAYGDDVFVTSGTVRGTMDGPWLGIEPTHRSFACAFVNVVPFRNGKMQGQQIYFDLPAMCRGVGVSISEVITRAAALQQS